MKLRTPVLAFIVSLAASVSASAQSARPYSIQGSVLYAALLGDAYQNLAGGIGGELQLRRTFGRGSVGLGVEYTQHDLELITDANPVRRIGPFVEPRLVIPINSNSVAPYLSARLAILRISYRDKTTDVSQSATGSTVNGGGGLLIRLGPRVNLDLGATFGYTKFGDLRTTGQSGGEGFDIGSGSNVIFRSGVTIGL